MYHLIKPSHFCYFYFSFLCHGRIAYIHIFFPHPPPQFWIYIIFHIYTHIMAYDFGVILRVVKGVVFSSLLLRWFGGEVGLKYDGTQFCHWFNIKSVYFDVYFMFECAWMDVEKKIYWSHNINWKDTMVVVVSVVDDTHVYIYIQSIERQAKMKALWFK